MRSLKSFPVGSQSLLTSSPTKNHSAIIPLILGDENLAVAAAAKLRAQNIFVPAIRYPTVARGAARLRITLTAAHSAEDVAALTHHLSLVTSP